MKLARLDATEDVADGCGREHSGFVRFEHPTRRRAWLAPNKALAAKANRRSLPLLNRVFSFGSRSLHLLEFGGRIFRPVRLATVASLRRAFWTQGVRKSLIRSEFSPKLPK